jgi:hypothetical protein
MLVLQSIDAPALSGLPPDPAPPLRPHSQSSKLCEWAELAALPRGCSGAPCSMAPKLRTPTVAPGSRHRLAGLDWRHGVGRLRRTVRRPSGTLGGVSNMRPIVLGACGLLNTCHDTRLGALTSDKAGAGTKSPIRRRWRTARDDCALPPGSRKDFGETALPLRKREDSLDPSRMHEGSREPELESSMTAD